MSMTKRELMAALGTMLAASALPGAVDAQAPKAPAEHGHDMSGFPAHWHGKEEIALLAYPQFTALDLVGPHYMFGNLMGARVHIVAKTRDPVVSDMNLTIMPTATFEECPKDLDILCVPGGTGGTLAAMEDTATIAFLRDRGSRAKLVTSVCTGSLLLGAAGLLDGYKATSHWAVRDVLKEFGAEPVDARVVTDRNRITGGGVTAGLDFGLEIVARLRDQTYAESLQLLAEYDPRPPFNSGTPGAAPKEVTAMMMAMLAPFGDTVRQWAKHRH